MTKRKSCDIIVRLSARQVRKRKNLKKTSKKSKKVLDKRKKMWYNSQAVAARLLKSIERRQRNCTLKIEQRKMKTKHIILENSATVKRCEKSFWCIGNNAKEIQVKRAKAQTSKELKSVCDIGFKYFFREFDPGSGWTLAACLTHSSRTKHCGWDLRMDSALT